MNEHALSPLPYTENALDPVITAHTIGFHYRKHHQGYVDNLNKLLAGTDYAALSLDTAGHASRKRRFVMLCKANELKGYTLDSLNGKIGAVKEFYFDDRHWTIRYLVAETGNWLNDRQVLISPYALVDVNMKEQLIVINLSKRQIEESPSLDSDMPVSQQFEEDYYGYYGWPMYSNGPYIWGFSPYIVRDLEKRRESPQGKKAWDPNLRSTHEVSGYHIQALDGEIGHVEDFIIDDETWTIRYLVVDTRNWWPGKKVLVSPQWIERVSWSESKIYVDLPLEAIKQSPEYTEEFLLTRDYETILHIHYNRKVYWTDNSGGN